MIDRDALHWGNPDFPWPLVGALLFLFAFVFWLQWRQRRAAALKAQGIFIDKAPFSTDLLRALLITAAAALIAIAIAKPRWGAEEREIKSLGIDIAFVLDASKSMKLTDVMPDRLEAAKADIKATLKKLHGGRVSFIPFAGLAFEQTPLTSDFSVLESDLDAFRIEDMPRGGTAIGRGLHQALKSLMPEAMAPSGEDDRADGEHALRSFEGAKHKAIVLLTDGEDHEGDAIRAAEKARDLGIKIFTVGVGTPQGRPVLRFDEEGNALGTVKGPDGKTPLFSSLNIALLKEIAEISEGEYFLLSDSGVSDRLAEALGTLEKAEYESVFQNLSEERFAWAALPAFLLLAFEAWLSRRRKKA